MLAVCAAFDYNAGLLKRSPRWLGTVGLEWLYRLVQEPRRLSGRYLRLNPAFLVRLIAQLTGMVSYTEEGGYLPSKFSRPG